MPRLLRVAAPLAALAYPALVAAGPGLWPPLLATALIGPGVAVWASLRLAGTDAPAARAVALAAVGAPALYSLLGGLLDFQHALPLTSVRVWIPLWLGLTLVAACARSAGSTRTDLGSLGAAPRSHLDPSGATGSPGRLPAARRTLVMVHALAAAPVAVFALAHVINHLCGLAGGEAHLAVMHALRPVYRAGEPVLLAAIAVLVATGLALAARRVARRITAVETVQTLAGGYLAMFFASHLTAVVRARGRGVDTDWHWLTDGGLVNDPWSARLVPYYAVGVIALAVHVGCAIARGRRSIVVGAAALGVAAAGAIVGALIA